MMARRALNVTQVFTSDHNPKGHADTQRLLRTLKEELIWLRVGQSHQELVETLAKWVHHYNTQYHYSAVGY